MPALDFSYFFSVGLYDNREIAYRFHSKYIETVVETLGRLKDKGSVVSLTKVAEYECGKRKDKQIKEITFTPLEEKVSFILCGFGVTQYQDEIVRIKTEQEKVKKVGQLLDSGDTYLNQAFSLQKFEEAKNEYSKALEIMPESQAVRERLERLKETRVKCVLGKGDELVIQLEFAKAIIEYNKALEVGCEAKIVQQKIDYVEKAENIIAEGDGYLSQMQFDKATVTYNKLYDTFSGGIIGVSIISEKVKQVEEKKKTYTFYAEQISEVSHYVDTLKELGVKVTKAEKLLTQAKNALGKGNYERVIELNNQAELAAEQAKENWLKAEPDKNFV